MATLFEKIKFNLKHYFPNKEYNQRFDKNYKNAMLFLVDNLQPSLTENEKKGIDKYPLSSITAI